MLGIVYILTNSINSKVYIGQTIQSIKDRWYGHCRINCSKNEADMRIKRAILKYGKENFDIRELERCRVEDLDEREIYYIDLYNSFNNGYNSTRGGRSGVKPLKLDTNQQNSCIDLYRAGFSFRDIGKEFGVDKATIKHIIKINNIPLRSTRTYKLCQEDRLKIIEESSYMSRKELMNRWNISKSYLSQLLTGKRRI